MKPKLHTIIFDAGGTLIDSDDIFSIISAAGTECGISLSREDIENRFMNIKRNESSSFADIKSILSSILQNTVRKDIKDSTYELVSSLYKKTFLETIRLFDGVEYILSSLKKNNIRIILLSDADADLLHEELKILNIGHYFDHLLISSEMRAYKPSARVVECVESVCTGCRDGILMVGDSIDDVMVANKMNIPSIFITDCKDSSYGQSYTISQLKEIVPLLNANFSFQEGTL